MGRLRYHVLASGSSGNMTLIQSDQSNVLVDCGISFKRTLEKLASCGILIESIDGILLTHSHQDHTKGVFSLSHRVPIYLTRLLFDKMNGFNFFEKNCIFFRSGEAFWVKNLRIMPIPVSHDCVDPVCFVISLGEERLAVMTDLGCVNDRLRYEVYGCQKILVEANYDLSLLVRSQRPPFLKNRILSNKGHLSNRKTGEFLASVHSDRLEEVVLLHLSQECNRPSMALAQVKKEMLKRHSILPDFQVAGAEGIPSSFQWL